jgi:hypothetical protein
MSNMPRPNEDSISSLIYIIRGEKVMLDRRNKGKVIEPVELAEQVKGIYQKAIEGYEIGNKLK